MTIELAHEHGRTIDLAQFNKSMEEHKALSRSGAEKKFKGGLAGHGEKETQYHTATHLLHQALRTVLGPEAMQRGSNITPERLRFDFTFFRKMTDEEKKSVEDIVNQKIAAALPVSWSEMTPDDARSGLRCIKSATSKPAYSAWSFAAVRM
jgi:alanyl-tRNA synthetase